MQKPTQAMQKLIEFLQPFLNTLEEKDLKVDNLENTKKQLIKKLQG